MKIKDLVIQELVPVIMGGNEKSCPQYRGLRELVYLFQLYGRDDIYSISEQEPKNPTNGLTYSRRDYVEMALREMNNTEVLYQFLEDQLNNELYTNEIKSVLIARNFDVDLIGGKYVITNVDVDHQVTTVDISFRQNRDKILANLNKAKVSIDIAMAWFTSDAFIPTLLQKQEEGITIRIIVNRDAVNNLHGCDLSQFNLKFTRGEHGGIMHHKLCVIDNQTVLTGSYNWSENAENRNVENVFAIVDNDVASATSQEFIRLWQSATD